MDTLPLFLLVFVPICSAQFQYQASPVPRCMSPETIIPHLKNSASLPPCNDVRLNHCQQVFNAYLGISGSADWTNPAVLQSALNNIISTNGTRGFLQICAAHRMFMQCLGPQYWSCISLLHFLSHNYNFQNSYYYADIMHQFHFQCGGGFETLMYNYQCINTTAAANIATLVQCAQQFEKSIQNNTKMACTYLATYLTCVRAPFQQNCNQQSGWFECEATRIGSTIGLPQCVNVRCMVGGYSLEDPTKDQDLTEDQNPLKNEVSKLESLNLDDGLVGKDVNLEVLRNMATHLHEGNTKD